jgi:hypothetical protein
LIDEGNVIQVLGFDGKLIENGQRHNFILFVGIVEASNQSFRILFSRQIFDRTENLEKFVQTFESDAATRKVCSVEKRFEKLLTDFDEERFVTMFQFVVYVVRL